MANRMHRTGVVLVVLLWFILPQLRAGADIGTENLPDRGAGSGSAEFFTPQVDALEQAIPSLSLPPPPPTGQAVTGSGPGSVPGWVEPRGISIVELVGQIPEDYLRGMIISYGASSGIVVYESGSRVGNTVVVNTTIYPRVHTPVWPPHNLVTLFGCLGQTPFFDHIGSVAPASVMRVYASDGTDVTEQVQYMDITRLGLEQPIANSGASNRYPVDSYGLWKPFPLPMEPDGLHVPVNGGCVFQQPGVNNYPLTGVFTVTLDQPPEVTLVGTQQATVQSFIGSADVGIFQPLMTQLQRQYGNRHTRVPLSIPGGASYFLVRFPPMPGDSFTDRADGIYDNADRLTGGTYRLSKFTYLSTDLIYSAAFPLNPAWEDADRAPGAEFLPIMPRAVELAPPEYVIPAGVPYDSCFTQGNCPPGVLDEIYNTEMTLDILYLALAVPESGGEWFSLKMAGPRWQPPGLGGLALPAGSQGSSMSDGTRPDAWLEQTTAIYALYLPLMSGSQLPPVEPPSGCPCGWFDSLGRMLYYEPGP